MRALHSHKASLTAEEREIVNQINRKFSECGLQVLVEEMDTYKENSRYDLFIVFDENKSAGRKEKALPESEEIRQRMEKGETAEAIADELGVGRATLFRHLKKSES